MNRIRYWFVALLLFIGINVYKSKKKEYDSVEEWKVDLDRMQKHPNDRHLVESIVRRVENSSTTIKASIKEYLLNSAMEDNPWIIIDELAREYPNYQVVIKNTQDPWFNA